MGIAETWKQTFYRWITFWRCRYYISFFLINNNVSSTHQGSTYMNEYMHVTLYLTLLCCGPHQPAKRSINIYRLCMTSSTLIWHHTVASSFYICALTLVPSLSYIPHLFQHTIPYIPSFFYHSAGSDHCASHFCDWYRCPKISQPWIQCRLLFHDVSLCVCLAPISADR